MYRVIFHPLQNYWQPLREHSEITVHNTVHAFIFATFVLFLVFGRKSKNPEFPVSLGYLNEISLAWEKT